MKNMVRIIANEWGGAYILITSDHGFLYTYSPLTEDDKVDKTTESDQDVEIDRRYAIMQRGAQPQYLLPVQFLGGETPYDAFAPRRTFASRRRAVDSTLYMVVSVCRRWSYLLSSITFCGINRVNIGRTAASMIQSR